MDFLLLHIAVIRDALLPVLQLTRANFINRLRFYNCFSKPHLVKFVLHIRSLSPSIAGATFVFSTTTTTIKFVDVTTRRAATTLDCLIHSTQPISCQQIYLRALLRPRPGRTPLEAGEVMEGELVTGKMASLGLSRYRRTATLSTDEDGRAAIWSG